MADLSELQNQIGYHFSNGELLSLALTHPSVAHESAGSAQHNQRLEFLGDAVLGLVITHELFQRFSGFGDDSTLTLYVTQFPYCRVAERDQLHESK